VKILVALALIVTLGAPQETPRRQVVITFDDLPVGGTLPMSIDEWERITTLLVGAITRHAIPAIGFVNESRLQRGGSGDARRVALLRQWLDAGLELGNHSFSHLDLHRVPLNTFQQDVLRGEEITRGLLADKGRRIRFFRHPFLHTGRTLEVKRAFEAFLEQHAYRVAPVTIDNYDYMFAGAFDRSTTAQARKEITAAYLGYMTDVVAYYERQAVAIVGRELPQVLLLHASALNAATLDSLVEMFRSRGYTFIPLERALGDVAYQSADSYVGPAGITWLHRWALTAGNRGSSFAGEPVVPDWIEKAAARPIP
jgi:peptidoglycan/xylan/chitin deacetylase (PgdA/CDA1 family)